MENKDSWVRFLLAAVAIPLFITALSTYSIPKIIETSNRAEQLRNSRLRKALEIGDRNRDFNSRLNLLKTRMHTFNLQNFRQQHSQSELREAQQAFQKEYTDDYLELDKMAWWWYWDLEREAATFNLLSPEEITRLRELINQYGDNTRASVGAVSPLWEFLSSSEYRINPDRQSRVRDLETKMKEQSEKLSQQRTNDLAKNMAYIFAHSIYQPPEWE